VLARVRTQPAWVVALVFGLLAGGLISAVDPGRHSDIAGAVAVVLLVGLAIVLFRRPDGEGWGIYSVLLLPSLALRAVDMRRGVEAVIYVVVTTLLAAALFDRTAHRETAADARSDA
jgi:hypothetical protein